MTLAVQFQRWLLREPDNANRFDCRKCQGRHGRVCVHPKWGRKTVVARSPNLPPLTVDRQGFEKIIDHVTAIDGYENSDELECLQRFNVCPVAFIPPSATFALEYYGMVGGMDGLRQLGILNQPAYTVLMFQAIEREINRLQHRELTETKQ